MPSSKATRSGTRRLSEVARKIVQPSGIVATGWPDVEKVSTRMGVGYDEWQRGAGRLIMAKRADGKLAAMVGGVGMSLPRQVGKTYLLSGLIFALCILRPGLLVIWTAQHSKTHEETFLAMQDFARRQKVKAFVSKVYTGSGDEEVRFANGSRILFGARERGFGRGIPGVDVIVFDEAQILSERAVDAMLATMNTSQFGLALYIGTPPRPGDASEAFTQMRDRALAGTLEDAVWIEVGAEPNADPDSPKTWAIANPSYPHRTPAESIRRLRGKLSEDSFRREALGTWDSATGGGEIEAAAWSAAEDASSLAVESFALGVEVGPMQKWASISMAGRRSDGLWHIELMEDQHSKGRGIEWLGQELESILERNPQIRCVVADVGGPIASKLEERNGRFTFRGTRILVTPMKVSELASACETTLEGVSAGWLRHPPQPQLSAAALSATKRMLADTGRWVWHRKAAESDITPIQSATYALRGAQHGGRRPLKSAESSGRKAEYR